MNSSTLEPPFRSIGLQTAAENHAVAPMTTKNSHQFLLQCNPDVLSAACSGPDASERQRSHPRQVVGHKGVRYECKITLRQGSECATISSCLQLSCSGVHQTKDVGWQMPPKNALSRNLLGRIGQHYAYAQNIAESRGAAPSDISHVGMGVIGLSRNISTAKDGRSGVDPCRRWKSSWLSFRPCGST
jgi:hypothetical protein